MNKVVIYPEYLDFLNKTLNDFEIFDEDKEKILNNFSETNLRNECGGKTTYTLLVKRDKHPINWTSKEGKIFEIIGGNMRNKTTTLIYTATILGFDWNEAEPYLEDKKLVKQARTIMTEISNGTSVELTVENENYRFEANIENAIANVVWRDKIEETYYPFTDISLLSDLDWEEYRNKIGKYFDVQVVGVGRNFITQVGFEEATNLAGFCNDVENFVVHYNQFLAMQKPRQNAVALKNQIGDIDTNVTSLLSLKKDLNNNYQLDKARLEKANSDEAIVKQLYNENSEIKEYIFLASKLSKVKAINNAINHEKEKSKDIQKQIKNYEGIITNRLEEIDKLNNALAQLKVRLDNLIPTLDLPKEISDSILNSFKDRDLEKIISFGGIIIVDEETKKAHDTISSSSFSGLSLETKLVGMKFFSNTIKNLSELKKAMKDASKIAENLYIIKNDYLEVIKLLDILGYKTSNDYITDQGNITSLQQTIDSLKQASQESKINVSTLTGNLASEMSGFDAIEDIKDKFAAAGQKIDSEKYAVLESITDYYEMEIDNSLIDHLHQVISSLVETMQENELKISDIDRQILNLRSRKKKLKEVLDSIDENDTIDIRMNNLIKAKNFVVNIKDYFEDKRRFFESTNPDPNIERNFKLNEALLGDDFENVIKLVNNRIMQRCPFAFINTNQGIQKHDVIKYDFLRSDFDVDELEQSSKYHGGITSSMTIYGLATKRTGAEFGSILLVDEWGDVGVYKDHVFQALSEIKYLSMAIFVDVDEHKQSTEFEVRI